MSKKYPRIDVEATTAVIREVVLAGPRGRLRDELEAHPEIGKFGRTKIKVGLVLGVGFGYLAVTDGIYWATQLGEKWAQTPRPSWVRNPKLRELRLEAE